MTETEFGGRADAVFARIETALDATDVDYGVEQGVLQIEFDDGSQIIVSRHTPNREIWVAAKAGGFHYGWKDGAWLDTRSGEELFATLARLVSAQAGEEVVL
jgi:CyaY protein